MALVLLAWLSDHRVTPMGCKELIPSTQRGSPLFGSFPNVLQVSIKMRGEGDLISALRPALGVPILSLGGCRELIARLLPELPDAFPATTLLSETVGLLEKVLGEFPWPRLGKMSNVIRVLVPSGPAADGCTTGAGWGTRTASSTLQGFKTWFSSSVQPNRVLWKVFHGELPACPKEMGAEQKSPSADFGVQVSAMAISSPCSLSAAFPR